MIFAEKLSREVEFSEDRTYCPIVPLSMADKKNLNKYAYSSRNISVQFNAIILLSLFLSQFRPRSTSLLNSTSSYVCGLVFSNYCVYNVVLSVTCFLSFTSVLYPCLGPSLRSSPKATSSFGFSEAIPNASEDIRTILSTIATRASYRSARSSAI